MTSIRHLLLGMALILLAAGHPVTVADDKKPEAGAQPAATPLVTRGRVELNLAGADLMIAAAKVKATAMGTKMNIAVVDEANNQAIVTSRPAAENRGLKPLPLGDDNGK